MTREDEYEIYAKRMEERFPKMYKGRYGGFAIGKGWWPLIEKLSETIQHHVDSMQRRREKCPQVVVQQVKEKFGTLRFYVEGSTEKQDNYIWFAESMSARTCEECGAPGKLHTNGWHRTLCDHHAKEMGYIDEEDEK